CSSHHKVKHHTEWHIVQDPAGTGTITWTSPAGFEYIIKPTPIARPAPHFTDTDTETDPDTDTDTDTDPDTDTGPKLAP
ncbi:MAG: endonuclease, partial [Subtercola sp.]|nr:endonuclease [Subtercola sp.]